MKEKGTQYDDMKEDLFVLLTDKTEGEAAVRVRGRKIGDGVEAYVTLYKWYTGTSGQAITERIRKLVSPATPKQESDIADAIDRWVDPGRVLENMKEEFKLQDLCKIMALEQLMNIGKA